MFFCAIVKKLLLFISKKYDFQFNEILFGRFYFSLA